LTFTEETPSVRAHPPPHARQHLPHQRSPHCGPPHHGVPQ